MSHRQFFIKLNQHISESACGICGKASEVDIGPELFTSEGYVCSKCGRESAPELAALLELAKSAEHYIAVIFELGDRPPSEDLE
jgi:hypothetical protein